MLKSEPLIIQEQGSFAAGGSVFTNPGSYDALHPNPAGQTLRGDHAYSFYQIPVNARRLPIVMWHGGGQCSKTWETTPDGREGFQNIFLRRGFSTHVIDAPRRGRAGLSTEPITIAAKPNEQEYFDKFRLGNWPEFFPNTQFSRDPIALDQFWRQVTPDTGPSNPEIASLGVAAVLERVGPAILMTHSQSGGRGWRTAILSRNVRAVVSYEPGSGFVFPKGRVPSARKSPFQNEILDAKEIPVSEFEQLTKIPIVLYYGDNIPDTPENSPADHWRIRLEMASLFKDAVNGMGGNVELVRLPEVGIRGNTHFPFSDLNNIEVADELSRYLKRKGLDLRP